MILTWDKFNESSENGFDRIDNMLGGIDYSKIILTKFNRKDIDTIGGLLTGIAWMLGNTRLVNHCKISFPFGDDEKKRYIGIYALEDEWFLINDPELGKYSCDQIEGVINCLKTIYSIS